MLPSMKIKARLLAGLVGVFLHANNNAPIHHFQLWGPADQKEKLSLYVGWEDGFFLGRGESIKPLFDCIGKISNDQAIAMITKYYKANPERWSIPFGLGVLEAITVSGSSCEGKNPFR